MHHSSRIAFTSALRCLLLSIFCRVCFFLPIATLAQETAKRAFDLPADTAERTLKLYSQQSGRALIMGAKAVRDIRTNEVRGEFTPREALDRMLTATGLEAVEDTKSGSLAVRKISDPNGEKSTQDADADRPTSKKKRMTSRPPQAS